MVKVKLLLVTLVTFPMILKVLHCHKTLYTSSPQGSRRSCKLVNGLDLCIIYHH